MIGFPTFQPAPMLPTVVPYGASPYGPLYPSVGMAPAPYCPPGQMPHRRRRGLRMMPQVYQPPIAYGHHYRHHGTSWRHQVTNSLHQFRDLAFYGRRRTAERAVATGTVLGATGATLGAVGASMIGLGALGAVAGAAGGAAAAMLAARALAS